MQDAINAEAQKLEHWQNMQRDVNEQKAAMGERLVSLRGKHEQMLNDPGAITAADLQKVQATLEETEGKIRDTSGTLETVSAQIALSEKRLADLVKENFRVHLMPERSRKVCGAAVKVLEIALVHLADLEREGVKVFKANVDLQNETEDIIGSREGKAQRICDALSMALSESRRFFEIARQESAR